MPKLNGGTPSASASDAERQAAQADIEARDAAEGAGEGNEPAVSTDPVERASDSAANEAVRRGDAEFEDDPRADLAKSIQARRGIVNGTAEDDADDEAEAAPAADAPAVARRANDAGADAPATAGAKAAARKVNYADLNPDDVVVLTINGRQVEVAAGDLAANAQKYLAGDDMLRQGKEILAEARRVSAPAAGNNQGDDPDGQNQPDRRAANTPGKRPSQTKEERDRTIALMDRVQTGTPEEAADAWAELDQIRGGATNQSDVARVVDTRLAERDTVGGVRSEVNEALRSLAERHPALGKIDELAPSLAKGGLDRMVEHMRALGVPEEDFNQPANKLIEGYGRLRQDSRWRNKLPPMSTVFDETATALEKRLNIQSGSTRETARPGSPVVRTTEMRAVRKTTIPQQPRPAAIRAEPAAAREAPVRDNSAVIARMAEAREAGIPLRR